MSEKLLTEQELEEAIELQIISPSFAERVRKLIKSRQYTSEMRRDALLEAASVEREICIGVLRELVCRAGMPDGAELLGKFMAGVNGIGDLGEELRSIAQEQERAQAHEVAK